MRPNPDEPDPRFLGLEVGVVVERDDPRGVGRIRVRIPGLIEPASAWAFPLGLPGGGAPDRGTWWVPEEGAEVGVFFKRGDPDHPYYLPANWGSPSSGNEVPAAAQVDDKGHPDIRVLAFGGYDLVVDTRSGSKAFRIVDKADGENVLEYDGEANELRLGAKAAIRVVSGDGFTAKYSDVAELPEGSSEFLARADKVLSELEGLNDTGKDHIHLPGALISPPGVAGGPVTGVSGKPLVWINTPGSVASEKVKGT